MEKDKDEVEASQVPIKDLDDESSKVERSPQRVDR